VDPNEQQPLTGYQVVELANWLAAPSAGAILADLGADVIKVEPPDGDPWRWFQLSGLGHEAGGETASNDAFTMDNRGKRSITLDLTNAEARSVLLRLVHRADVLLTNWLPRRLDRLGLDYHSIQQENSRIVYAMVTGYGTRGPDANRLGFDYAAFWARSGIMGLLGEPNGPPVLQRGGMGDHTSSLALTTAVLSALLHREKTGEGQRVEASLLSTALWVLGVDLSAALKTRAQPRKPTKDEPVNPIWNAYQTSEGRWILLVMPVYERYWPRVARAIGREDLAGDERFITLASARAHSRDLVSLLVDAFRGRTLAEWAPDLDDCEVVWAPVQLLPDVLQDNQVQEMEYLATYTNTSGESQVTVAAPFSLDVARLRPAGPAPQLGQHTEQVLLESGYDWPQIAQLRNAGALG
jgi:crotonobetainyl-CoA:carnitine CoA-transferase CaiB-like acyl-CoA transferase